MKNDNSNSNVWYEKTWLVILLCIFFFPVGLYALWKNSSISKGWKIGVTTILFLAIIVNLTGRNKVSDTKKESSVEEDQPVESDDCCCCFTYRGQIGAGCVDTKVMNKERCREKGGYPMVNPDECN